MLDSLKRLAEQALSLNVAASLLGIEGTAARLYFQAFPTMLREDKRLRRRCVQLRKADGDGHLPTPSTASSPTCTA